MPQQGLQGLGFSVPVLCVIPCTAPTPPGGHGPSGPGLALFTGVRGIGILRSPHARSCIALVLGCQKRPMAPVLRIEAGPASWGAACIYIVVNKVDAFIPVSSATATLLYGSPYGNHGEGERVCGWCT